MVVVQVLAVMTVAIITPLRDGAAVQALPEARTPSYAVSDVAREIIEPWQPRALGDDETFLRVLASVLGDQNLTDVEKADAFLLMLRKIGWAFSGTMRIPPAYTFARLCSVQDSTLLQYQATLQALSYQGSGLLEVVRRSCSENVMRCSNALLLAGLVDRNALRGEMKSFLTPKFVKRSEVPPILLYYLAIASVLARDPEVAVTMYETLWDDAGEEGRETMICTLGMYEGDVTRSILLRLANNLDHIPPDQAEVVDTLFEVLRKRLPAEEFERLVVEASQRSDQHGARLNRFRDGAEAPWRPDEFAGGDYIKVWDDFSITVFDDGYETTYGAKFRDFQR